MGISKSLLLFPVLLISSIAACSGSSGTGIGGGATTTDTSATDPGGPPGSGNPGGGGGGEGTGHKPPPPPPPTATNGPPTITSVTFDKTTLGPGDDVTITAVVTDPDGANDITGGVLLSPKSTNPVVAFAKKGSSYEAKASLAAFDSVDRLTLAPGETAHRAFTVRFDDTAGHSATKDVALDFAGLDKGICAGAVVSSFFRDCSSCPTSCAAGSTCMGNVCATKLDCGFAAFPCSQRCSDAGSKCLGSFTVTYAADDQLSQALSQCNAATKVSYGFSAAACAQATPNTGVNGCFCGK